jgi:hypothetical protein
MTEKINGEQAAQLYLQGKNIQFLNVADDWIDADESTQISFFRFYKDELIFREKPPVIVVNNVEVPAPVKEPIPGKEYFVISGSRQGGYDRVQYNNSNFVFTLGCWQYEKDILKVVAAFGKSFKEVS